MEVSLEYSETFGGGGINDDNDYHAPFNTVVGLSSEMSELGVFMIVNYKGKLATPQRSC